MSLTIHVATVRDRLAVSVLRLLTAELGNETLSHYDDTIGLYSDEVDMAAQQLTDLQPFNAVAMRALPIDTARGRLVHAVLQMLAAQNSDVHELRTAELDAAARDLSYAHAAALTVVRS